MSKQTIADLLVSEDAGFANEGIPSFDYDEMATKIKALFLEIIGEDEELIIRAAARDAETHGSNNLRAELRNRVNDL